MKKVYIGNDHAGVDGKKLIISILKKLKVDYEDLGSNDRKAPDDYPDFAKKVAKKVASDNAKGKDSFGILLCGTGSGMVMAANKVKGIRAAFSYDEYSSKMARLDNDANVLCLRNREFDLRRYNKIIKTFLKTEFSGIERHKRRVKKINRML